MNRPVSIPRAFHEVFGRTQTPAEIVFTALAAVGFGTVICIAGAEALTGVATWRSVLAVVLIVDIAAGCIANFTYGTDRYYAESPTRRWVFVAVHWHLVAVSLLLNVAVVPMLLVTIYALLSAAVVNLLHGSRSQVVGGGVLTAGGIVGIILGMPLSTPPFLMATAALFVVKVVFAFAVTHHPPRETGSS